MKNPTATKKKKTQINHNKIIIIQVLSKYSTSTETTVHTNLNHSSLQRRKKKTEKHTRYVIYIPYKYDKAYCIDKREITTTSPLDQRKEKKKRKEKENHSKLPRDS